MLVLGGSHAPLGSLLLNGFVSIHPSGVAAWIQSHGVLGLGVLVFHFLEAG